MGLAIIDAISEDPVFKTYFFYSSILIFKMLAMSILTARQRIKHKTFASPEDYATMDAKFKKAPGTYVEDIERVRRGHLNDLENIPLFFIIGFIYCFTNPSVAWATMLFRIYTAARIFHTIVYTVYPIPQPARALAWAAGYIITGYMAFICFATFS